MALPGALRQALAGGLAALVFLVLFFGLTLVWWAAFAGALLVFAAVLLIVPRRPEGHEVQLTARVTEADIREADQSMTQAIARLDGALDRLPATEAATVAEITSHLRSIHGQVLEDPQDYRRARRFITSYLPRMVDTVDDYARLVARTRGQHDDRLAPIAQQIKDFAPVVEKIDTACLENDFASLEAQISALSIQMKRG